VDWIRILNQVKPNQSKDKLPPWFATKNIIYPSKISIEQTSSQKTAEYKASLVSGESLIDLTGGFGVRRLLLQKNKKVSSIAKSI
jgi:hypothetical protein